MQFDNKKELIGICTKKLCKSETDKMLFGICGGLGEYFDISSTLIRIIWVIAVYVLGQDF